MCGIAGMYRFDGGPVDHALLRRMTAVLAHRGPDGEGLRLDGPAGLGSRRLSIIDLSGAKAPLCKIWKLHEPEIFAFWREQDRRRFATGLPWKEEFLLIELSSPVFWFHLIRHLYIRLRTKMRKWQLGR